MKTRTCHTSPQTHQTESPRPHLHFRAQEALPLPLLLPTLVSLPLVPLPPASRALQLNDLPLDQRLSPILTSVQGFAKLSPSL